MVAMGMSDVNGYEILSALDEPPVKAMYGGRLRKSRRNRRAFHGDFHQSEANIFADYSRSLTVMCQSFIPTCQAGKIRQGLGCRLTTQRLLQGAPHCSAIKAAGTGASAQHFLKLSPELPSSTSKLRFECSYGNSNRLRCLLQGQSL